jgi:hypothetical protein
MDINIPLSIQIRDDGYAAEAMIMVGDNVIGYVGGSRYAETVKRDAEKALAEVLKPLVQAHYDVSDKSRFDDI